MSGTRQERVNDPAISLAVDQLRLAVCRLDLLPVPTEIILSVQNRVSEIINMLSCQITLDSRT